MARLVVHTATGPKKIEGKDGDVFICQCGLSTNKPFCSGAHKTIPKEPEGELKVYDESGDLLEFEEAEGSESHHHEGCCGGGCCGSC